MLDIQPHLLQKILGCFSSSQETVRSILFNQSAIRTITSILLTIHTKSHIRCFLLAQEDENSRPILYTLEKATFSKSSSHISFWRERRHSLDYYRKIDLLSSRELLLLQRYLGSTIDSERYIL